MLQDVIKPILSDALNNVFGDGAGGVLGNLAPYDIQLSNNSVAEDKTAGWVIGGLTTSDYNVGDTHTYSIVTDAGNKFAISGNNLVVRVGATFDFETTTSHNVTIRTTDQGGLTFEKAFTIEVTDILEGLSFPSFSSQFFRISANNIANVTETFNMTFTPSNVILADSRISIADTTYSQPSASASGAIGTRVRFSSTGTLPSPLNGVDYYYLCPHGNGGYELYPECTQANWGTMVLNLRNNLVEESPLPAQNFFQKANRVIFTSQGSGTHTVYSPELVKEMPNMIAGGVCSVGTVSTNKHDRFEIEVDTSGKKAINSRRLLRDFNINGVFDIYGHGKDIIASNSADYVTLQNFTRNKRTLMLTTVMEQRETDNVGLLKAPILATNVNTATGVLTYVGSNNAHAFTTGRMVILREFPAGALPTGFSTATVNPDRTITGSIYYARSVTATTLTLHATSGDATTNTNVIIPTTQGTNGFTVVAIQQSSDRERMRFISEIRQPTFTANSLCVRTNGTFYVSATDWSVATSFTTSGTSNGRFGSGGNIAVQLAIQNQLQAMTGNVLDAGIGVVRIKFPMATIPPIRSDTGAYLADGEYYVTRDGTSTSFSRLHDTLANARLNVGISTQLSTCIKYTTAGSGFFRPEQAYSLPFSVDTEKGENLHPWSPINGEKAVYSFIVDYNDPTASFIKIYIYKNGVKVVDFVTNLAKGNTTSATQSGNWSLLTFLNSSARNGTWEGLMYDFMLDSFGGGYSESNLVSVHNYMKSFWNI